MTILLFISVFTMVAAIVFTRINGPRRRAMRVLRYGLLYPLLLFLSFVLVARWELRSSPAPRDTVVIKRGKQAFENTCTGCHSIGKGRSRGPDLKYVADKYDPAVLSLWMMNSDAVYAEYGRRPLSQSYPPMPRLDVSKADADAIAIYLMSLSQDQDQ
jgi:mono/diheme cytochrome c family protein